jgi:aspartyl-tRNA(Asn)/glutamyl-tRNA(Gln) amidotransferase subunit C
MVKINIDKIAKSAAIKLHDEEKDIFKTQVQLIVEMLSSLQKVDTEGVEPLMSITHLNLRLREDIAFDPHSEETVMKSTNYTKYGYFATPKFLD